MQPQGFGLTKFIQNYVILIDLLVCDPTHTQYEARGSVTHASRCHGSTIALLVG